MEAIPPEYRRPGSTSSVDVLGLIIGVVILAASAHDGEARIALLDQAAERCGIRLEKDLGDQGSSGHEVL
ncbi:hypothetical protein [Streptomyces microflavus]